LLVLVGLAFLGYSTTSPPEPAGLERPGLPAEWVPVLEHHPEGVVGLPGHVWLDMSRRVPHVRERELEFAEAPPM
jgi:hypothetical protein